MVQTWQGHERDVPAGIVSAAGAREQSRLNLPARDSETEINRGIQTRNIPHACCRTHHSTGKENDSVQKSCLYLVSEGFPSISLACYLFPRPPGGAVLSVKGEKNIQHVSNNLHRTRS